jgi:predicted transposase YbfD/YdcC
MLNTPSFMVHFQNIKDPRVVGRTKHKLFDIIFIAVASTIAGCDDWNSMEVFAEERIDWFKKYCELPNGIPSLYTLQRVISMLNPKAMQKAFSNWMQEIQTVSKGAIVAIDGKTLRRSFDTNKDSAAIHVVSAWLGDNRLTLGQLKTEAKSNEIKAIPQLLELIELQGAIVTVDAMGCQKEIVSAIREKGADYVITVKGNQGNLRDDVEQTFEQLDESRVKTLTLSEEGHGRIEKREYFQCNDLSGIRNCDAWKGLKSLIKAVHTREEKSTGKISKETRYFISSLPVDIKQAAKAVRGHWGIENSCHYVLDVVFREDHNRTRKNNGAENLSVIRRMSLNYLQQATFLKCSIKNRRFRAALSTETHSKIMRI